MDFQQRQTGDIVLVRKKEVDYGGANTEGRIIFVVQRKKNEIVGTAQISENYAFVVPDDKTFPSDIFIPKKEIFGANNGDKVLVSITKYANRDLFKKDSARNSEGRIIKIIARNGDTHLKLKSLLADNGIDEEFKEEVIREAENMPKTISEEELVGRKDLRDIYTITIDGEDAKDLDDAVAIEKKENYRVWISIADVSHYIKEGSLLDKEAEKRRKQYLPYRHCYTNVTISAFE